jgi:mono/diheme cytochrome c family protein
LAGVFALVAIGAVVWFLKSGQSGPDQQQLALGRNLYAANCAVCHGDHLQGQPNWQRALPDGKLPAPPLNGTGHASHHPQAELFR